jgi:dienelactone hydrolase
MFLMALFATTSALAGAAPLALSEGRQPADNRLHDLRTTDSYFPMRTVDNAGGWRARQEAVRLRILVAAGLHPLPDRSPLNARVFGRVDRDEYTVDRVVFESFPGHFVTGSLYRPKSAGSRKFPAVLNPYGHWGGGRFQDHGAEGVRKEIDAGAERFETGGRHVIQARCVQLARMGCIAFVYDMEGTADSVQLPHAAGLRPEAAGKPGYLFFSPEAELRGQTMFGLQTWNSIRALDFLCSLPDVDRKRIAVTGASGGGTQTMILSAIDDRIAAAFPAVMVSTAMQGGCMCENAAYLRINQGNVDIAAATAPRPLGLIAADDWTKELETKGHPDLKRLYEMLGHPQRYEAHFHIQFPHNYNSVNREHLYSFMNRHLRLGLTEPIRERDYVPLDPKTEASVWTAENPKPTGDQIGEAHERRLTALWTAATDRAMQSLSRQARRQVVNEGQATIIGRFPGEVGPVTWAVSRETETDECRIQTGTLTVTRHGEQLPATLLLPRHKANGRMVLWLTDTGKAGLFRDGTTPVPEVTDLLNRGCAIASIDLFGQGEFLEPGQGHCLQSVRMVTRGQSKTVNAACYTFGYNPPLTVQRAHDVLSLVAFLDRGEDRPKGTRRIECVAKGPETGTAAALAAFLLDDAIKNVTLDPQEFDFKTIDRLDHPMMLPGILRYGGLAGRATSPRAPLRSGR